MVSKSDRPQFLTKKAVKTIADADNAESLETLKPIFQIINVKDVRKKKNMKDKLTISDGTYKMVCIVKEKINQLPEQQYKALDIIRINKFALKEVGNVKVMIPSNDFDIVCNNIDAPIGKPKEYNAGKEDDTMDFDPEIPYKVEEEKQEEEQEKEIKDVEMKTTPIKEESKQESFPDIDDVYTPIKALSPMNSDWIVKARISKLYPVKEWNNSNGSGKLMNFELVDRHGSQIQATIFNKAVDKFESILKQDKCYIFCKGTVKVANKKFTAIKNDYCLTFSPLADITPTEDDNAISNIAFNFSTLKEVQSKGEGKALDILGVVTSVSEPASINLKSGGTKDKRDYEILDNSVDEGIKTIITLWGENAKKFDFKEGEILAFKGLRVTQFKGITLNGGDYTAVHDATKLNLKEVPKLRDWYNRIKGNLSNAQSLTESNDENKKGSTSNVRLIKEIEENVQNDLTNDPQVRYYINARVEMIKSDNRMVYMACPSCKKKMQEEDSGMTVWRCERCNMSTSEPVPTYMISAKFSDATGSIWVRVHGISAQSIMGNMTAEKFREYLVMNDDEREAQIKDLLAGLIYKNYCVMVKPSISEYQGQETLSYFGSKVYPFSCPKNNDFLLERLYAYKRKQDMQVS